MNYIEKKASKNKILAKKISDKEIWVTNSITAPITANIEDWLEFNNVEEAYIFFKVDKPQENENES